MSKRQWTIEFKVGLFVLICLVGLGYMTYRTGNLDFRQKGYYLYVIFDESAGLGKKAPVMLNGLEVGRVDEITPFYDKESTRVKLKLWLQDQAKIREESYITIKMMGMMGEKYVHIESSKESSFVKPGSVIEGQHYVDLDTLIRNLNDMVSENRDSIKQAVEKISSLIGSLDEAVSENRESLSRTIRNFEITSENFEEFSDDLKRNPWKLLFRTKEKLRE